MKCRNTNLFLYCLVVLISCSTTTNNPSKQEPESKVSADDMCGKSETGDCPATEATDITGAFLISSGWERVIDKNNVGIGYRINETKSNKMLPESEEISLNWAVFDDNGPLPQEKIKIQTKGSKWHIIVLVNSAISKKLEIRAIIIKNSITEGKLELSLSKHNNIKELLKYNVPSAGYAKNTVILPSNAINEASLAEMCDQNNFETLQTSEGESVKDDLPTFLENYADFPTICLNKEESDNLYLPVGADLNHPRCVISRLKDMREANKEWFLLIRPTTADNLDFNAMNQDMLLPECG